MRPEAHSALSGKGPEPRILTNAPSQSRVSNSSVNTIFSILVNDNYHGRPPAEVSSIRYLIHLLTGS